MLIGYARISKAAGSQSLDLQRGHSQRFDAWNLGFVCILYLVSWSLYLGAWDLGII